MLTSENRIHLSADGRRAAATALRLRAELVAGRYACLGEVAYGPEDPRNQPTIYRTIVAALIAEGPSVFVADPEQSENLIALAERIADPSARFTIVDLAALSESAATLARIHMGQWHIPFETIAHRSRGAHGLHAALFAYGRGGSSLTNPALSEDARHGHDLHQVLRHALAHHREPAGGWTVMFDPPMRTARDPLPRLIPA